MIPLALVGMSYREAPSAVRASLVALDAGASGPGQQLLDAGEISGVVRIESCARVEWLVASQRPAWAAELLGAVLTGAAAVALGATTFARVHDYRTVLSIWEDALRKAPRSTTVRNNLGNAYAFAGRLDEAEQHFQRALDIDPSMENARRNLEAVRAQRAGRAGGR